MLEACATPDLVAEITLQPVRRHGIDAAILFSDIVVPLKADRGRPRHQARRRPGHRPADPHRCRPRAAAAAGGRRRRLRGRGRAPAGRRARRDAADRLRGRAVHPRLLPGRGRAVAQPRAHQGADVRRPGPVGRADAAGWPASPPRSCGCRSRPAPARSSCSTRGSGRCPPPTTRGTCCRTRPRCSPRSASSACPASTSASAPASCSALMGEAGADVVGVDFRVPLDEADPPGRPGRARCRATSTRRSLFAPWDVVAERTRAVLDAGRAAPGPRLQPRPRRHPRDRPRRARPRRRPGARGVGRADAVRRQASAGAGGGAAGVGGGRAARARAVRRPGRRRAANGSRAPSTVSATQRRPPRGRPSRRAGRQEAEVRSVVRRRRRLPVGREARVTSMVARSVDVLELASAAPRATRGRPRGGTARPRPARPRRWSWPGRAGPGRGRRCAAGSAAGCRRRSTCAVTSSALCSGRAACRARASWSSVGRNAVGGTRSVSVASAVRGGCRGLGRGLLGEDQAVDAGGQRLGAARPATSLHLHGDRAAVDDGPVDAAGPGRRSTCPCRCPCPPSRRCGGVAARRGIRGCRRPRLAACPRRPSRGARRVAVPPRSRPRSEQASSEAPPTAAAMRASGGERGEAASVASGSSAAGTRARVRSGSDP